MQFIHKLSEGQEPSSSTDNATDAAQSSTLDSVSEVDRLAETWADQFSAATTDTSTSLREMHKQWSKVFQTPLV